MIRTCASRPPGRVHRIRPIPAVIVQGRYDVVCPMKSARDLHRAWPEADLRILADAGHCAFERGDIHELVTATDRYAASGSCPDESRPQSARPVNGAAIGAPAFSPAAEPPDAGPDSRPIRAPSARPD